MLALCEEKRKRTRYMTRYMSICYVFCFFAFFLYIYADTRRYNFGITALCVEDWFNVVSLKKEKDLWKTLTKKSEILFIQVSNKKKPSIKYIFYGFYYSELSHFSDIKFYVLYKIVRRLLWCLFVPYSCIEQSIWIE